MATCTLIGYQHKNYVSKSTGKQVDGTSLHFACPSSQSDFQGHEVFVEFLNADKLRGVKLTVGATYDVEYGKGYGGKAVVSSVTQKTVA